MNSSLSPEWLPSFLTPFVTLSYPTDPPAVPDSFNNSPYYDAGLLDGCFIITCIAVMAVLRDALRLGVFEPFARWYLTRELLKSKALQNGHASRDEKKNVGSSPKANGAGNGVVQGPESVVITRKEARLLNRSVMRFAEQGWSFVYYTLQWLYGLYVHYNLPTRVINPVDVWTDYPHIRLAGPLKFYYLTQTAFYMHQVLILNAEARRKDHWQMMAHHVITIGLVLGSYSYHFTRIGCLVMMLMDCCDIFLPLAKMLRYLTFAKCCDATFGIFLLSWLVTRHFLFLLVIKSTMYDLPATLRYDWEPSRGYFFTQGVYIGFNAMLISLQIIQLVWFWMICRVAYRVIMGYGAEDTRSDDEAAADSHEEEVKKER